MLTDNRNIRFNSLSSANRNAVMNEITRCDALEMLALLLQYPSSRLVSGLIEHSVQKDILSIGVELECDEKILLDCLDSLSGEFVGNESVFLHYLKQERTRLFDHPDKPCVPLYEDEFVAVQLSGEGANRYRPPRFVNRSAVSAEEFYRRGGFKRTESQNIPADCMTTELMFLAALAQDKAKAILEENNDRATEITAIEHEFVGTHVDRWFIPFFEALESEAHGFYSSLGVIGGLYLQKIYV